jgi:hypothetical protein
VKPTHPAIRDVLARCGPLTSADLAEFFPGPMAQRDVASMLGKMRRAKVKLVYIQSWEMHRPGEKSTPRPVYALGDKPDANPPRKQSAASACARYRAKQKVRAPNSVFQLARFL